MELTILGIDQGNGNMKTASYVFPYGFKKQETKPYADVVKVMVVKQCWCCQLLQSGNMNNL